MRNSRYAIALLFVAGTIVDCECSDNLSSIVGELYLELCSSDAACGCVRLAETEATIDFGHPDVGDTAMRTFYIFNDNKPQSLTIDKLSIADESGEFSIDKIKHWTSEADDAIFAEWEMDRGNLTLLEEEYAEVVIIYEPSALGEHTAVLSVGSNSSTRPLWEMTLRSGPSAGDVLTHEVSCPSLPPAEGEPNCALEMGTHSDGDIAIDLEYPVPAGRPPPGIALSTENITITNDGDQVLFVAVTLTKDGIPELTGTDLVGDIGVFFLQPFGCTELQPGESIDIGVEFRPFQSGTFLGEVKVSGLDNPIRVQLVGHVTGPAVCITTEDEHPDDASLVFGIAPWYATPKNPDPSDIEMRHIYIQNCGYVDDLIISDAVPAAGAAWNDGFTSAMIEPWTDLTPIPVGETVAIPFEYEPLSTALVGSAIQANITFISNAKRNQTLARLYARVGAEKACVLIPSPTSVDFGWVAANEAGAGNPLCPPFCGGEEAISRIEEVVFLNVGQRVCTNINIVEPDGLDLDPNDVFEIQNNPNGPGFDLDPLATSQPIEVMFNTGSTEDPVDHLGKLPYTSDSIIVTPGGNCPVADHNCISLSARGGGNPNCEITFAPVNPPGMFCPGFDWILPFGNVNVGQERTIDFKMTNTGSDTCNITSMSLSSAGGVFSMVQPGLPVTIAVNAFETVPVTFAPVPPSGNNPFDELPFGCGFGGLFGGGEESLTVNYESVTSGDASTKKIALSGKGTRPDIDVIPGEVDFGDVTVGCCSADVRIAIYNSGDGTLTINGLGFSCDAAGNCDQWSGADPTNPTDPGFQMVTQPDDLILDPGENTEFYVRFCAAAEGEHSGVLEIISTDDNEEYFTISMNGNGTWDDQGSDDFSQPLRPMVDVLWAVDDSGSMGDEQQSLANNFDSFINTAVALDTDYHLGVVSTYVEGEEGGMLYACSGPLWISDTQPTGEQQNQFRCNVKTTDWPRPNSDSKEAGLQAARLALDYPHIDGHNLGFYREEAKLYIIIVTDEEDQSDGTPQQYVDFFQNLKGLGNPDLLNISAVSGPPPDGCDTAASNQFTYDAVDLVGGQFRSICTPDWSDMIAALGLDVFNARQQFPLSRPATAPTIAVVVCDEGGGNCVSVPEDSNNGWTFDPELNAITFHGDAVPGPGQEINVSYTAICYQ